MFGLTKREQRWKAEQKAAETLIPMITAITVEAMKQDDKNAEIEQLRETVKGLRESAELRVQYHSKELAYVAAERDQLRQYLDAAQRRGEDLRAQVAALEVDAGRMREALHSIAWSRPLGPTTKMVEKLEAIALAALAARKGEA